MKFNVAQTNGTKALAVIGILSLVACSGGRSPLNSLHDAVPGSGGKLIATGGVRMITGGIPANTGGNLAIVGGALVGTGGRLAASGGAVTVTGGMKVLAGGSVVGAGGNVNVTGGRPGVTGGVIARTGGTVLLSGGSISLSGGAIVGSGGRIAGTGGTIIISDAGVRPDSSPDVLCGPICNMYCPYGYKTDVNGCSLCLCNGYPDASVPIDMARDTLVSHDLSRCLSIACPAFQCLYGYVNDAAGCPTCECTPGPVVCPPQACKPCPFGNLKDAQGCVTCDCAPNPNTPCNQFVYSSLCNATNGRCLWLAPGCGSPSLATPGCFEQALLDCQSTCPNGLMCLQRSATSCLTGDCPSCGALMGICL